MEQMKRLGDGVQAVKERGILKRTKMTVEEKWWNW
jgi:hypothetical protein